jgi:hypothetical protein
MGKAAARLTVVKARALIAKGNPARHGDGGNLYLHVTGPAQSAVVISVHATGEVA